MSPLHPDTTCTKTSILSCTRYARIQTSISCVVHRETPYSISRDSTFLSSSPSSWPCLLPRNSTTTLRSKPDTAPWYATVMRSVLATAVLATFLSHLDVGCWASSSTHTGNPAARRPSTTPLALDVTRPSSSSLTSSRKCELLVTMKTSL